MKTELTQHCVDNVGDVGGGVVGQQQRVVGGELQQHTQYNLAIIIAFITSQRFVSSSSEHLQHGAGGEVGKDEAGHQLGVGDGHPVTTHQRDVLPPYSRECRQLLRVHSQRRLIPGS